MLGNKLNVHTRYVLYIFTAIYLFHALLLIKNSFLYARTSRMVFATRKEAVRWLQREDGPSSPQHLDSDGIPLSPLLWPDDGTVPPWRRRADGTEIPPSPERRYTAAEMSAALPPGFLDPLPPHLRYPYRRREPEPQPETQP